MKKDFALWQKLFFVTTFYTNTFLPGINPKYKHWNEISDGLFLGALPIATHFAGKGNHGEKIIAGCSANRPLGAVYSVVNPFEISGEYLGLKPVSPIFWKSKKIKHHLIPVDDFGANIDVKTMKQKVDSMHLHIKNGRSVYVHCKAGKGRSFMLVVCYLLAHTKMDMMTVLALVKKQRYQVSPSNAQFRIIEAFRAKYCPHKAPLNKDHLVFQQFRKDYARHLSKPLMHAGIVGAVTQLIKGNWFFSGAAAVVTGLLSYGGQYLKEKFDKSCSQGLGNSEESLSKLTLSQLKAVKAGMESALNWRGWRANVLDTSSILHYACYRGGMRLSQEFDPICDKISTLIEIKSKP